MKNKLTDLNNHLFAQLERLGDEDLAGEELTAVIERGKAISDIAVHIIATGNLQVKAMLAANEMGITMKTPPLLMTDDSGG